MEGQKIEIEVGNSLAAMAYVVADQQRMFREKDNKIQELEQKCKNFAKNLVNLEAEYNKSIETIKSFEKEQDQLRPRWVRVEFDEKTRKATMPSEGKWIVRCTISEEFKGSYYDCFGVSCVSGMNAYIFIDTKEPNIPILPFSSKVEALSLGNWL